MVRLPSIHNEKPGLVTYAYDPSTVGDGERSQGSLIAVSLNLQVP